MTSQEQLALLLDLGNLHSAEAAKITRTARLSIESYRKPSWRRPVPRAVIACLETYVMDRLAQVAKAAGYELKPIGK